VLLHDSLSLLTFEDNEVVIPLAVIRSLKILTDSRRTGAKPAETPGKSRDCSTSYLYPGTIQISVSADLVDRFYRDGSLKLSEEDFFPHQCVTLKAHDGQQPAIGRFDQRSAALACLQDIPWESCWGIQHRNREQHFAFELLLNPDIHLVTLVGRAGTGKTLLAIAAGLHNITEVHQYRRLLVSRPVFPMGRDLGFLPGDI
jgi:PhoH-like ATPase